jgi:DNA-binding Lrp family transcriptional regulator
LLLVCNNKELYLATICDLTELCAQFSDKISLGKKRITYYVRLPEGGEFMGMKEAVQEHTEEAFILLRVKPGKLFSVAQEARKHPDVKISRAVAGQYDVVLYVQTESLEDILEKIHSIDGIERPETLIALEASYRT